MKKIIYISAVVILYIMMSNSCKKDACVSNNLGNVSFKATDLQIVPYKGTETLTFSDSLGNTMITNGQGRNLNFNQPNYENYNPDGGCQGDYFYSETNYISFIGYPFIEIYLTMDSGSPFEQNIKKYIEIYIAYGEQPEWYFNCIFYFDAMKLTQPASGADADNSILSFNDSLKIGNKMVDSVYVLKQIQNTSDFENLQYVYYRINQGIVGFRTSNGHVWYLNYEKLKSLKGEIKSQKFRNTKILKLKKNRI